MALSLSTGMAASNASEIVHLNEVSYSTSECLVQLKFITLCAACARETSTLSLQSTAPGYSTIMESKPACHCYPSFVNSMVN